MKPIAPSVIPFRFVQHKGPDDWLHYELLSVHGELHAWTIPAHRHEAVHQFQLVESGRCRATLDGEEIELQGPCALMLPPGAVHGFTYQPGCRGRQVTVPSQYLQAALSSSASLVAELDATITFDGTDDPMALGQCVTLFDTLAQEFERLQPGRREALQALSVHITLWFLRQAEGCRKTVRRDAARDTLVQRYLSIVEENLGQRQPIARYAERLGVTTDHLSRVCRLVKGMSALELLHERQYLEARRLLTYTSILVSEVAATLGFEDSGHFSRFFARRAGQSPASYRHSAATGRQAAH